MKNEVHIGDIGTAIQITIMEGDSAVDISASTARQILLRKPSGSVLTKAASFVTDGSDGLIRYLTIFGDIDVAGTWGVQAVITMPSGVWHTDVTAMDVLANLA